MKRIAVISILVAATLGVLAGENRTYRPGEDVLHYSFAVALTDSSDMIRAAADIDIIRLSSSDSIIFDLLSPRKDGKGMKVDRVLVDGRQAAWKHSSDRLAVKILTSSSSTDTLHVVITYHGIPVDGLIISRNIFGDRTFFSDHWPDRAHGYLPCVDHPSDKATVDFEITAPESYSVVANGIMTEESSLPGGLKLTRWSEYKPLPVKVMAFGVARFAVRYESETDRVPVWTWVFPQNREAGFSDFAVAVKPLGYFSSVIGPYPFEKLANVQSRTMYGGMENAGAIFYAERAVTGLGKAEQLIAHEIAHQWFGDCVTETDWSQVWLSEGFATYLSALYGESVNGKKWFTDEMSRDRNIVIRYSRVRSRPLVDSTETRLMELLNPNSYQKGAWVLHMLRNNIGDKAFFDGLRSYYNEFSYSNASSADFQKVMEEVSGKDLSGFFRQWLHTAGQPILRITSNPGKTAGTTDITIRQLQDQLFSFDIDLLVRDAGGSLSQKVEMTGRTATVSVNTAGITEIIPDPGIKLLFERAE